MGQSHQVNGILGYLYMGLTINPGYKQTGNKDKKNKSPSKPM